MSWSPVYTSFAHEKSRCSLILVRFTLIGMLRALGFTSLHFDLLSLRRVASALLLGLAFRPLVVRAAQHALVGEVADAVNL